jgi:hypothetical protein
MHGVRRRVARSGHVAKPHRQFIGQSAGGREQVEQGAVRRRAAHGGRMDIPSCTWIRSDKDEQHDERGQ